jgi:hypothetical protein
MHSELSGLPQHLFEHGDKSLFKNGRLARGTKSFSVDDGLRPNLPDQRRFHVAQFAASFTYLRRMRRYLRGLRNILRSCWRHGRMRHSMSQMRTDVPANGDVNSKPKSESRLS